MFDLKKAVSEWKRSLRKYESFEDGSITELESHLLDVFEQQKKNGLSDREAFDRAVASLGRPVDVGLEYFKENNRSRGAAPSWQPPRLVSGLLWHYLKLAGRQIRHQKRYSIINGLGLAVSLACGFMMLLHVQEELGYEKCFPKSGRIYRTQINSRYGSNNRYWATSAPALGSKLLESFPEIESTARIRAIGMEILTSPAGQGAPRKFEEMNGFFADSSFCAMFDLRYLQGNPRTALQEPRTIVLTETLARKYFPNRNPLGQTLTSERTDGPQVLHVTGVIRDLPGNTHLQADYLVSMPTFPIYAGYPAEIIMDHRLWKTMYTFALLKPGQSMSGFSAKAPAFMKNFLSNWPGQQEELRLQPIQSIHLRSKLEGELGPNSDISYVYIFSGTALLLLIIAGVNFVNLAIAQSFKRMKETGIRKVLGATRGQLIRQHLGESALLTSIAFVISVCLLTLALPYYNQLTGKFLRIQDILTLENLGFGLLLFLLLGFLAGLYPAFIMSGFRIQHSVKAGRTPSTSTSRVRQALVVFQFSISVFIIFGALTINRQLDFFHNRNLGFDKDKLIAVSLDANTKKLALDDGSPLKTEILNYPWIRNAALVSGLPGTAFSNERLTPTFVTDRNSLPMLRFLRVDERFIETAGLTIIQGRNFGRAMDQKSAYIISESARAANNLEKPLGVECLSDVHEGKAPIIGVIKDFHFASLHNAIEPLVLEFDPHSAEFLLIKTDPGHDRETLEFLRGKFNALTPGTLFRYQYLAGVFDQNYETESRVLVLFQIFSVIAMGTACLGLFGLSAQTAESRVKEIGIRKVLGASKFSLACKLSASFIQLVFIGNLLAWPAACFALGRWLENFAYRIHLTIWMFLFTSGLAIAFALLTVSFKAIGAARSNPVDSLKYE